MNDFKKILPIILMAISIPILVTAQYRQFGQKIIGTGSINSPYGSAQGTAIDLSNDGKIMVVGGSRDNDFTGAFWIYSLSGTNWKQIGNKMTVNDTKRGGLGVFVGYSISISGDGNTIAVGGYFDNDFGAVWLFSLTGENWIPMGNKISGKSKSHPFGISVDLSEDGKTLAVGGNGVQVYSLLNGAWSQFGNDLISSGEYYVSISSDGKTIATGSPNLGATIFNLSGTVWTQENTLFGTNATNLSRQGSSIKLSADGKVLVVGGDNDSNNTGAVWTFLNQSGSWTQMGDKLVGKKMAFISYTYFGCALSLSQSGNILVVGGNSDSASIGAVWTYSLTGSNWTPIGNKFISNDRVGQTYFGASVSLSSNASTLAVGGRDDNNGQGAAWVFTAPGWNSDTITSGGGTTDPITSDTLSISGTVHQGTGLLTDGIVMAIEKTTNKSKILRVTNGNFILDSLVRGEYIIYAVPNPVTVPNYLPTFYVNKVKLQNAVTLSLRGHIRSVDIYLAALTSTITGTHTITGRFSYEDGYSKDSSVFASNWFGQSGFSSTVIPISTNSCGNMPVLLYNSQNSLIKSTLTDSLGYFTFKNLPADTYKLLGQRNGYASKNQGTVTVGSNPKEIVNLKMEAVVTAFDNETALNKNNVIVYPNPFKDEIVIKGYLGDVTVYDLTGKIFYQTHLNENESINTNDWPEGFYILKVGSKIEKVIKQE